ncbi:MAG: Uma2 family endonuclease [Synechococcaceae cyanobacterium SM2_3_1]|nr:Uma2 family endonuclease [Synechococcaceae cyanobacterium SM2_3_1]
MFAKVPHLSFPEYLAQEQASLIRHEYVDGQIFAMTGASENHNLIALAIASRLRAHLRGSGCRVFISDMKVCIESAGQATYYPDVMVVCDPQDDDPYVKRQPVLIVEILSPSTAATDRREKLVNYAKLPTLQEYVLVAQDEIRVEAYRFAAGEWFCKSFQDLDQEVQLSSVNLSLPLQTIYEDIQLRGS